MIYFNDAGLPEVTVTPYNQSVEVSRDAKFICNVKGVGPFTYQWRRKKIKLSNEIQSTMIINRVSVNDASYYKCFVRNNYGHSAVSDNAFLQVTGT